MKNATPHCCNWFGLAKPASSIATPTPLLAPLAVRLESFASCLQKEKKGFDFTDIQHFLPQKTEPETERACERQNRATWHLRTVPSLVSIFFFSFLRSSVVSSKGREYVWRGTPLVPELQPFFAA